MPAELRAIDAGPPVHTSDRFPIVLSVGERRPFTANDIFRVRANVGARFCCQSGDLVLLQAPSDSDGTEITVMW
jgi:hypothetical protein